MFVVMSNLQPSCFTKQALHCTLPPWAEVLAPTGRCAELKADWGRLYNVGGNEGSATQLFHEPGLTLHSLSLTLTSGADRQLASTNGSCVVFVVIRDLKQLFHKQQQAKHMRLEKPPNSSKPSFCCCSNKALGISFPSGLLQQMMKN